MRAAAAIGLAAAVASCGDVPPFRCENAASCGDDEYVCTVDKYCAYADSECASGLRYDESAGDELADECVAGTSMLDDQPRPLADFQMVDLAGARDDYAPRCATATGGRDLFFDATVTELGRLYIDTFGSDFNVVIAVHRGTCAAQTTEVTCGTGSCNPRLHQWSDLVEPGAYCVIADRLNDAEPGTTLILRSFIGDAAPLGRIGTNTGDTCDDDVWEGTCSGVDAPDTTWFVMSCTPVKLLATTCTTEPDFDGDLQARTLSEVERACTGGCPGAAIELTEPGATWIVAEARNEAECGPIELEITTQ